MESGRQGTKGAMASHPSLARRVSVKRSFARLVLMAEKALPLTLPVFSTVALFLSAAWFGVFRIAPEWLRLSLLFAFCFVFLASLLPFGRLRWPSTGEADRLLEERNDLPHQPVSVQMDEPAHDSAFARALWKEHQDRMAARIANLDAGLPRPDIARYDSYALRAVPALLFAAALGYSFSNSAGTVADAFHAYEGTTTNTDLRVDAWVTPPGYTGKAPIYLTGGGAQPEGAIGVPQASELTVRLTGGNGDEQVTFQAEGAEKPVEIVSEETKAKEADAAKETPAEPAPQPLSARTRIVKLDESGTLSANGQQWLFNVIPDNPPEIAFEGIPRRSINGALEIGFRGKDDYGIAKAHAEIVPVEAQDPQAVPLFPPPEFKLDLPRRNSRESKGVTSRNLTEHPLAGKPVRVTLVAEDALGQVGRSQPHEMVLPSRGFSDPLAGSIAEERQIFSLDVRKLPQAMEYNEALALRADETIPNLTHFLLLRSALGRMQSARDEQTLKDAANHLWEIAIGIEDGDLSLAERNLRDAQQALADALERNAPDDEIKKLMDELRKAMQEYLNALAERMQNNPQNGQNQSARNFLRQQDLQSMLDQIENLARSGNRDQARQMLSEMQRLMNNLQAGRRPQQGESEESSKLRQQIDKLGELMQNQQRLMEETFKLDQALKDRMLRGDPGDGEDGDLLENFPQDGDQQPSPTDQMTEEQLREALKQLKEQQDALGDQLGELQKGLGELGIKPGEGFDQAGREMRGASGALGEGQGEQAVQGQGRALEALRQGAQDMMNQMMQAMQGQQGEGQAEMGQNGRDPLGRPRRTEGPDFGDDVKVPDEIDVQRAREILEAIREKLGGNPGTEVERRYLERLLDIQ
ncbi:TIGR02302 family protein [Rhizobiaceae bacterium n13]|uniref:TIGR02302 family protein n=1 Tax=Ferirhizobium litorale TaxID=2927786 RepID=A0AAE3U201_9HYPH|nr:TIGR02302 family protein [Fererhizobium litorale]MDI7862607.1 TIGR02302 family protein [Fererhizobium litorale]MDI7923559.1 TIGR02302 family protein [Fererhizobium litorale]